MPTVEIPKTQRAWVQAAAGDSVKLIENYPVINVAQLTPGQCLVKLHFSGVCHSDLSIKNRAFARAPKLNLIGGHEGIGIVVAIAEHTLNDKVNVGDRVGIKFVGHACLDCETCRNGNEATCTKMKSTGNAIDGTFSEYAIAYVDHIIPIPDSIDSAAASPIMCAGITVYSALRRSDRHIGDWVVIPGAGGGLGHLAIQYAVAMGLRVIAIDTGEVKKGLTLKLGAEHWIDFNECKDIPAEVLNVTGGGAHAAIVAAGSPGAYNTAVSYLRPAGYLMVVGLPGTALFSVPISLIAARALTVRGVFVGNRQESIEALQIAAAGKVKCHYTIRKFSELNEVYEEMEKGHIAGRVVLDTSK